MTVDDIIRLLVSSSPPASITHVAHTKAISYAFLKTNEFFLLKIVSNSMGSFKSSNATCSFEQFQQMQEGKQDGERVKFHNLVHDQPRRR